VLFNMMGLDTWVCIAFQNIILYCALCNSCGICFHMQSLAITTYFPQHCTRFINQVHTILEPSQETEDMLLYPFFMLLIIWSPIHSFTSPSWWGNRWRPSLDCTVFVQVFLSQLSEELFNSCRIKFSTWQTYISLRTMCINSDFSKSV
jgi:hypothetical protein